jgi:DNA-binding IclR family transcriptional regulator
MIDAEPPVPEEKERYIVPALRRGLAILQLFGHDRTVIGVPEIVRELGISRATAFRLVYTLEADGYLQRAPHSHAFRLGIGMLSLGFEYLGSLDVVEVARPVVEDLRNRTDASSHIGLQDGTDAVTVFQALSRHRLRSPVTVGTRMPAHATSLGRALLMDFTLEELRALYAGVKMRAYSPQTPTSVTALHRQLEIERGQGHVAMYSGYSPGIVSIAAPIRDGSGQIVASVNVSDHESLPALREPATRTCVAVMSAAETIASGLGYRGQPRAR